jgi:hypothetical protein
MKKIIKNWKTSLGGLATVLTGVVMIANKNTSEGVAAILTGISLIFAKDADNDQHKYHRRLYYMMLSLLLISWLKLVCLPSKYHYYWRK